MKPMHDHRGAEQQSKGDDSRNKFRLSFLPREGSRPPAIRPALPRTKG
jgi:hypothetical protein